MKKELQIIQVPLVDLKPYAKNPRVNQDSVPYVMESIKQFGFLVPIVIDEEKVIVAGHTRYEAAKRLGMEEVPCVIADHLNTEQLEAFRLADNKVGENSLWHIPLLQDVMKNITTIDMASLGFVDVGEAMKNMSKSVGGNSDEKTLEKMELMAFEHYDYLVFVFSNQMDWLRACQLFDIKKVDITYGKHKFHGTGRIVFGSRLFEHVKELGLENSSNESGAIQNSDDTKTVTAVH
jgi:hypothetical protein